MSKTHVILLKTIHIKCYILKNSEFSHIMHVYFRLYACVTTRIRIGTFYFWQRWLRTRFAQISLLRLLIQQLIDHVLRFLFRSASNIFVRLVSHFFSLVIVVCDNFLLFFSFRVQNRFKVHFRKLLVYHFPSDGSRLNKNKNSF